MEHLLYTEHRVGVHGGLPCDEQLAWFGALASQGFLAAVLLGMAFLLAWGTIAEKEWKEILLRFFLMAVGFLGYMLSGIPDRDLEAVLARPLLEMGDRPWVWASAVPAGVGLLCSWLLMRAVKAHDRRPIRALMLVGPVALLVYGQLVLPTLLQLGVLDFEVLVPGVAFGAGMVFYIAFIEDWRTLRFGFLSRIAGLFQRTRAAGAGERQ